MPSTSRPAHVPPGLVRDFNVIELPDGDPRATYLALRDIPIFWTPRNGGHWIVTGWNEVRAIAEDPAHFCNESVVIPREVKATRGIPHEVDGEVHRDFRRVLQIALAPSVIQQKGEVARDLANRLIDGFYAAGRCDFAADFAERLPIEIFLRIMDIDLADRSLLVEAVKTATSAATAEVRAPAYALLEGYLRRAIDRRRDAPGDDLLSRIVHAEVQGRRLTEEEMLGMATSVLMAGLDTVSAAMSGIILFLARNPAHRQALINDPARTRGAVEELLRRFAPPLGSARVVAQDCEFAGVAFRKGESVFLSWFLANMDERQWTDPGEVDFARRTVNAATFGFGDHRCPGSFLARTEITVFLEEWLRRIPDFAVAPGHEVALHPGIVVNIRELPITWPIPAAAARPLAGAAA